MLKFHHIGIPTDAAFEGEIDLPHLKVTVSDPASSPFGIQWGRCWPDARYLDLFKRLAHVAFEVGDIEVVVEESQDPHRTEQSNAPVDLLEIDHSIRPDL